MQPRIRYVQAEPMVLFKGVTMSGKTRSSIPDLLAMTPSASPPLFVNHWGAIEIAGEYIIATPVPNSAPCVRYKCHIYLNVEWMQSCQSCNAFTCVTNAAISMERAITTVPRIIIGRTPNLEIAIRTTGLSACEQSDSKTDELYAESAQAYKSTISTINVCFRISVGCIHWFYVFLTHSRDYKIVSSIIA